MQDEKKVYEKPVLDQVGFMIDRTQKEYTVETSCCICKLDCDTNGGVCHCELGECEPRFP
jgi:hypothetical protein